MVTVVDMATYRVQMDRMVQEFQWSQWSIWQHAEYRFREWSQGQAWATYRLPMKGMVSLPQSFNGKCGPYGHIQNEDG
ncbi:hypothetical protein DPMN_108881 [Dreissena polymorpha]|uniref:Uncharacterized protein n=1 Tax=Dreissena polymorpha TaxID=45954 RepID=A0A9D4QLF7_DREPO|nr:hypothetical protein DPMN_108881 [Dreissena polymorpha]